MNGKTVGRKTHEIYDSGLSINGPGLVVKRRISFSGTGRPRWSAMREFKTIAVARLESAPQLHAAPDFTDPARSPHN